MTFDEGQSYDDLRHSMARGAAWMIAMRWMIRGIGLINTIILARLLVPADFGLIAMASVVLAFLDSIIGLNVETPLVRNMAMGRPQYDSAWTLQVIEGVFKTGLYICIAPLIAAYFDDPRIETIVYIIALRPGIDGFENIGQVNFRRELRFDKEFRYWVYRRLLTFLITIGIALWMRNYLALAIAAPVGAATAVLLSFIMSSYRPRFSLSHIGEIWAFSKWWMLSGSVRFFGHKGEEFILGGLTTPQIVGAYSVAGNYAAILTSETILPAGRALLPNYARMLDNPPQLLRAFQLSLGLIITLALAAGVGASLMAEDLVLVVLGPQWYLAVPFFQWLALHSAFWCIVQSLQPYFFVTNRERLFALCGLGYIAILIPAIVIAAHTAGAEAVPMALAQTRTIVTALFMLGMLGVLLFLKVFSLEKLVDVLWRPVIACTLMAICVWSLPVEFGTPLSLGIHVSIGASVFFLTLVFLWVISGRPSGIESAIFSLASDYVSTRRRKI